MSYKIDEMLHEKEEFHSFSFSIYFSILVSYHSCFISIEHMEI